jgi:hypothetical protein
MGCLEDASILIQKNSYLSEIKYNNKNFLSDKKNVATPFIDGLDRSKAGILRQFFPEMVIFTIQAWPLQKEMLKENERL